MLKVPAKDSHAAQTRTVSPGPIAGPSTSSTPTAKTSSSANTQAPAATAQGRKFTANNLPGAVTETAKVEITRAPALRSVALTITPTHRRLALDARDGVRCWSLRLAPSERGLHVSDVRLFRSEDSDDEDEGSEEDEAEGEAEEKEEEEEEEEEGDGEDGEDGEDASGEGEGDEGGGSKDLVRARKKEEVERVGRVKRPPPMRVRLDKTEVECRGRGRWEVSLGPGSGARVLELSDTRAGDHSEDPRGVWRVYLHCTA